MYGLIASYRPSKVPAGQADGIQPRTIEVFQASFGCVFSGATADLVIFRATALRNAC